MATCRLSPASALRVCADYRFRCDRLGDARGQRRDPDRRSQHGRSRGQSSSRGETSWNLYRCWIAPGATGRPRPCLALTRGAHHGTSLRYPPDPPTVEEIIAVMCATGQGPEGIRLRGVIIVLWRAGLRISEALVLAENDL